MSPLTLWLRLRNRSDRFNLMDRRCQAGIIGILLLFVLVIIELDPVIVPQANAQLTPLNHTSPTVDSECSRFSFSPDGNPFPLCPGPYPIGGNCVWWAWEQWHFLDYNLPLNWGNAADWIVDAERSGLPLGTMPRVGSIAVFPRVDGVWAFGRPGHVAFVTAVSPDGGSFNVTYQNYGDPTPMYVGIGYNVSVINEPRYQNGEIRFIYFPKAIDPRLFARLAGVDGNAVSVAQVAQANNALTTNVITSNRIALGLPPTSTDQEFNADFTGTGLSDLLLYNRQRGALDVLNLSNKVLRSSTNHWPRSVFDEVAANTDSITPLFVSLADATTPVNGWGSSLDVHIGDFAGTGESDILLYNRNTGTLQLISLTPQLTIKKHVTLTGWGPGWEIYVGRFDGQRSGIFMYNRFANFTPTSDSTSNPPTNPPSNPTPSPTHKPGPTPGHTPTPTKDPTPSPPPGHTPDPTPSPPSGHTPTPTKDPTPSPTPSPAPSPTSRAKPSPTPSLEPTRTGRPDILDPTPPGGTNDLSGDPPSDWEKQGRTANILVLDFNKDFSVRHMQQYTLWHDSWEVYVGRFKNSHQDGLFIYDRNAGEVRIMDFDSSMLIADYQEIHNLTGNWEVYSGDFKGSGRAQVLLYDPSSGDGQFLVFAPDLSLATQKTYSGWGENLVLYVGHFGMPTLSVMLYDSRAGKSTFVAFDPSLKVMHQYTVKSWDQHWQVLIGSFLDRSRCLVSGDCTAGDDIPVLNRQTGQIQQYIFSFDRQFQVFDNRTQPFIRDGILSDSVMKTVDTTTFSLSKTFSTSIGQEELY